jgi:DNA-binding IscR family transcriptional regulator
MSDLSESLKKLLHDSLGSLDELAVIMFLYTHPQSDWTCSAIAQELKTPEPLVSQALIALQRGNLLITIPGAAGETLFRRHPTETAVSETLSELIGCYRANPLEVVKILTANAIERMRTSALRTFANSFLLEGRDPNG